MRVENAALLSGIQRVTLGGGRRPGEGLGEAFCREVGERCVRRSPYRTRPISRGRSVGGHIDNERQERGENADRAAVSVCSMTMGDPIVVFDTDCILL